MREKALEKPKAVHDTLKTDMERLKALREKSQDTDRSPLSKGSHARDGP